MMIGTGPQQGGGDCYNNVSRAGIRLGMSGTQAIALTGASGFIGTQLLPLLVQRQHSVRALLRPTAAPRLVAGVAAQAGTLEDVAALTALVHGCDSVIHLAGYAHASSKPLASEIERHRRINLVGTQALFSCAAAAGVRRFVFVSSVKAGGEHLHECLNETSGRRPLDPYGQIKREIEDWLFEQGAGRGVEICVLRPALVYGPGVKGNLAAMLRSIDQGRFPPVPDTHNVRSMVSVQDVVSAVVAATERAEAAGQVCIVEDGQAYSTRRIYTAMANALGKPVPAWTLPAAVVRGLGYVGDIGEAVLRRTLPFNSTLAARLLDSACYRSAQAEQVLGFKPAQTLEDALPDMVRIYRAAT